MENQQLDTVIRPQRVCRTCDSTADELTRHAWDVGLSSYERDICPRCYGRLEMSMNPDPYAGRGEYDCGDPVRNLRAVQRPKGVEDL